MANEAIPISITLALIVLIFVIIIFFNIPFQGTPIRTINATNAYYDTKKGKYVIYFPPDNN